MLSAADQDWIIVIHCSLVCLTRPREASSMYIMLKKCNHITPIPGSLLWLPITTRSELKVLMLTFKALHGLAPSYLKDLIISYSPSRPLRSSGAGLLLLPKVKNKSAGQRAFAYRAPYLWNSLTPLIRKAESDELFKAKLKNISKYMAII